MKKKLSAAEKKKRKKLRGAAWLLFFAEILAVTLLLIYFADLAVLPHRIFTAALVCGIIFALIQLVLLVISQKHKPTVPSKMTIVFCSLITALSLVVGIATFSIYGRFAKISEVDEQHTIVSVYTLKSSSVGRLYNLRGHKVGTRALIDTETTASALETLTEKLGDSYQVTEYIDFISQIEALKKGDIDAIVINEAFRSIINEQEPDFDQWARAIYHIEVVKSDAYTPSDDVKMTHEPFVLYLSGVDTRTGKIVDYGKSDVNMLVAVNPVTKKVLLINVPRDYYVGLYGDSSKLDKLTHAGIYGIDCSISTLSALFDVEIDNYVKVNFKSVVDIIDALGGVTVNSDVAFSTEASLSGTRYDFVQGENTLTGDSALAFCRERYSFRNGDRQRGMNQQKVISAVIGKISSPSIATSLTAIVDAIVSNVKTGIPMSDLNSLVQMQLTDMASWSIESISVNGSDLYTTTYSAGSLTLYVMKPDYKTVDTAKEKLQEIFLMP